MMEAGPRQEPQMENGGQCFSLAEKGNSNKHPGEEMTCVT